MGQPKDAIEHPTDGPLHVVGRDVEHGDQNEQKGSGADEQDPEERGGEAHFSPLAMSCECCISDAASPPRGPV